MKYSVILAGLLAIFLVSCGKVERMVASTTGYSEMCVDGVKYIQFTSGSSVKYRPDGSVATCS